jgi:hypothetical protein
MSAAAAAAAVTTVGPPDRERRDNEPSELHRTHKQDLGIEWGNAHGVLPQFARSVITKKGKEGYAYVTGSYRTFWRWYKQPAVAPRHYFEVQRNGVPGHIYLDCECTDVERGPALRTEIIVRLSEFLRNELGPALPDGRGVEPLQFLEIDSSSPTKFSVHLIVRLRGGRLMLENRTVGALMRRFDRALFRTAPDALRVRHSEGTSESSVIDYTVYTDKRVFRLTGSTKMNVDKPNAAPRYLRPTRLHGFGGNAEEDAAMLAEYDPTTGVPHTFEAFARTLIQRPPTGVPTDELRVLCLAEYTGDDTPSSTNSSYQHMRDLTDRFTRTAYLVNHPWRSSVPRPNPAPDAPFAARILTPSDAWAHEMSIARRGANVTLVRSLSSGGYSSSSSSSHLLKRSLSGGAAAAAAATARDESVGVAVLDVVQQLSGVEAIEARVDAVARRVTVHTRTTQCAISGREHRGNHIYFEVVLDPNEPYGRYMHYRQLCHDDGCRRRAGEGYEPIPPTKRLRIERALEAVSPPADTVSLEHLLINWVNNR